MQKDFKFIQQALRIPLLQVIKKRSNLVMEVGNRGQGVASISVRHLDNAIAHEFAILEVNDLYP